MSLRSIYEEIYTPWSNSSIARVDVRRRFPDSRQRPERRLG